MLDYFDLIGIENVEDYIDEETQTARHCFRTEQNYQYMEENYGGALSAYEEEIGMQIKDDSWKLEI